MLFSAHYLDWYGLFLVRTNIFRKSSQNKAKIDFTKNNCETRLMLEGWINVKETCLYESSCMYSMIFQKQCA